MSRLVRHGDRWMLQNPAPGENAPMVAHASALTEDELRQILNDKRSTIEDVAKTIGEQERRHVAAGGTPWRNELVTGCHFGPNNPWDKPRSGLLGKLIDRVFGRRLEN